MKTIIPNDLGKKYLVEDCQKIRIDSVIRVIKNDIKKVLIKGQTELNGFNINIVSTKMHHSGERLWFECSICLKPVGIMYQHPVNNYIGCRTCLNLEYKSRRYKGMIENKKHPHIVNVS